MSASSDVINDPSAPAPTRRFVAWPLWIAAAGLLGLISTLGTDERIDSSADYAYPITVDAIPDLSHTPFRIGGLTGYLTVIVLLFAAAVWRHRVERRYPWSLGASVVTFGIVSSAGALALVYGWKGALGNYLHGAAESNTYDDQGLYMLYMINDFGPYFAWVPALASALGLAYMAFREGLVSRVLGAGAGLMAVGVIIAVAVTGVPGLPFMIALGIVIAGVWLAVGRSAITQDER